MRRFGLRILGIWLCCQVFPAAPGLCQYANPTEEAPYQKSVDDHIKDGGGYFKKDSAFIKSSSAYFPQSSAYFKSSSPYFRQSSPYFPNQDSNIFRRIVRAITSLFS